MKTQPIHRTLTAICSLGLAASLALAEQAPPPTPTKAFDTMGRSSDLLKQPTEAQAIARTAYVWGWPMVNQINQRAAITQVPQPGRLNGVLPAAPRGRLAMLHDYIEPAQTLVTGPNQDVVSGLGFFSLDEEPAIIQVPDFGDRFWVFAVYDERTNQFAEIGKPYDSHPGFYLLAGPNWKGGVPEDVTAVIRCSTELASVVPRIFLDDTADDREELQSLLNEVVAYPLKEFDGHLKKIDWAKAPALPGSLATGHEAGWVVPEKYFDQLGVVLDTVPPLPGEDALYASLRELLKAAGQDPAFKAMLVKAAVETEQEMTRPYFRWDHNGKPAGNNWHRSVHNAETGHDYFNRAGTAKANMLDNKPNETQYFFTHLDGAGAELTGAHRYEITFPAGQEPPVQAFWSLTLYNEKDFLFPNPLKRYALGTKNKALQRNADGSLTLYAGAQSPGKDKESNWLPAPDGRFSLYLRAYWGQPPILDGSWQPPAVRKVD